MPRSRSLTGAEIRRLKPKKRLSGGLFSLSLAGVDTGRGTCACVVSKKVAASAVARNLIKRRCKEAIRLRVGRLAAKTAYVFTARKPAADASFADISREIGDLLEKAGA